MNTPTQADRPPAPESSCGECLHTFRRKCSHDSVVCVPHLKTMPSEHSDVCELHCPKEKKP